MSLPLLSVFLAAVLAFGVPHRAELGLFEGHGDVGHVEHPGVVRYDAGNGAYTVSGSGENMWFAADAFHYVWKKVAGDVEISADIAFIGAGKNPHRKACLVIRQSLDADSAYADIARHGEGLTSLQYRDAQGGTTHEVQSNVAGPMRVRLERRGDTITASVLEASGSLVPMGGSVKLKLAAPFYIGLGVCSHEKDLIETAVFSHVVVAPLPPLPDQPKLYSTLETVTVASTDRRVVRVFADHVEAPNWTPDGASLIYNCGGKLHRVPVSGGEPTTIDSAFADRCNNDHGLSPDGKRIAISDQSQGNHQSAIYTLPAAGGTPKRITEGSPSYWHGWSPDGSTLAFCGQRDGKFGIFTVPADGGPEKRLTTADGLDDGPDYSPDGKYIYFNSDRSGRMQIYRMNADGASVQAVTSDEFNNWFPHVSPDGKLMVFLSYEPDVKGHPPNKDVQLRLMNLADGNITVLAKLFGGQGTINVPSWSPDSKKLAFVSYLFLP